MFDFNLMKVTLTQIRTYAMRNGAGKRQLGGQKYGLITYFPRFPDHKDPPIEPAKLFAVRRIKRYSGLPYWEKDILKRFKLDNKGRKMSIVKNIPEVNAMLWKIKHLIQITPVQFPNGEPKEDALTGIFLHENGSCMVSPNLVPDEKRIAATKAHMTNPKKLNNETLREDSRMKWLTSW